MRFVAIPLVGGALVGVFVFLILRLDAALDGAKPIAVETTAPTPAPTPARWAAEEHVLPPSWNGAPVLRRFHDHERNVTCWVTHLAEHPHLGVACIPDWQLKSPRVEALP